MQANLLLQRLFTLVRAGEKPLPEPITNLQEPLANLLQEYTCSLKDAVELVRESDRTGWKEVVGNLTQITGFSLKELGIPERLISQLSSFGKKEPHEPTKQLWKKVSAYQSVLVEETTPQQAGLTAMYTI